MVDTTAGEVTAQWFATMAASHWRQPRACQAFTPRTYDHNSLISSLIQSVFTDGVDSGAAGPVSRPLICITEESTIRVSLLKSPWSDLWFRLIVSDTVPLFHSALSSITMWLVQGRKGQWHTVVLLIWISSSVQNKRTRKGVWVKDFELQHSAHVGHEKHMIRYLHGVCDLKTEGWGIWLGK